jgi:hypothetical protein
MAKRASLTDFAATKPTASPELAAPVVPVDREIRRGVTLRLRPDAWRQLKIAAVERDAPAHDLLVEAVNDWFTKHGKPPIA